jgi:hypothetical protein
MVRSIKERERDREREREKERKRERDRQTARQKTEGTHDAIPYMYAWACVCENKTSLSKENCYLIH